MSPNIGKRRGHQDWLINNRTGHRRNAAGFVHGWANDGEVEPIAAADAVEHFADMQAKIHVGDIIAAEDITCTLPRSNRST